MSNIPFTPKPEFTKLRDLLAAKDWLKADKETAKLIITKALDIDEYKYNSPLFKCIKEDELNKILCEDLEEIDKLWMYYSNNKFGFSIQFEKYLECLEERLDYFKRLKENCINTPTDYIIFMSLSKLLGWRNTQFHDWNNITEQIHTKKTSEFFEQLPKGFFPRWGIAILDLPGLIRGDGHWQPALIPGCVGFCDYKGNGLFQATMFGDKFYKTLSKSNSIHIISSFFSLLEKCIVNIKNNDSANLIQSNKKKLERKDSNNFVQVPQQLDEEVKLLDGKNYYTPESREIAQERIIKSIAQRKGQPQFRAGLLEAYNYRCAITGCDAQEALEAAHIIPYCETEDNDISNGLLLRADIHTLFDLNLIAIEPETYKICLAPSLQDSSYYNDIKDKYLELPNPKYLPNKDALEWRWKYFEGKSEIG